MVEPLIEAFNDSEVIVRQTAAKALIRLREPAVLPLTAALKDKREAVKRRAAQVLADLADVRSVQPLIAALENGDSFVKWEAVRALNRIGTKEALTAVRQHAAVISPRIQGQAPGHAGECGVRTVYKERVGTTPFARLRTTPSARLRTTPFARLRTTPFARLRTTPFARLSDLPPVWWTGS